MGEVKHSEREVAVDEAQRSCLLSAHTYVTVGRRRVCESE